MTGVLARLTHKVIRPAPAGRWVYVHRQISLTLKLGDAERMAHLAARLHTEHIGAAKLSGDIQRIYRMALAVLTEVETYRTTSGDKIMSSEWWDRMETEIWPAARSEDIDTIEDIADRITRELLDTLADLGDVDTLARIASMTLVQLTLYPGSLAVSS